MAEQTAASSNGFGPDSLRTLIMMLAGAGAAMSGPDSFGGAVGGITASAIKAQNYKDLLQKFLQGGGKMSMDQNGMKMQAPLALSGDLESIAGIQSKLQEQGSQLPQSRVGAPMASGQLDRPTPAQPQQPQTPGRSFPFSSSPLVDPGLAGLTPGDIASAFGLAQNQEELMQRQAKMVLEQIQLSEESRRASAKADLDERKFKLDIFKELSKDERTELEKIYDAGGGKKGFGMSLAELARYKYGTNDFKEWWDTGKINPFTKESIDFGDWKEIFGSSAITNFNEAKKYEPDLTFPVWQERMAEAASTTVSVGPFEKAAETSRGKQRAYYESADFRNDVVKGLGVDYEFAESPEEKQKLVFGEMNNQIMQSPRFKNPKFGRKNGVVGWYDDGGNGDLIRAWSE